MKRVLDRIRVDFVDSDWWQLVDAFRWNLEGPDGEEFVDCPAGMYTDFGSIPPPAKILPSLSPTGRYLPAFLVHDKLFQAPVIRTATSARPCGFGEANTILLDIARVIDEDRGGNWFTRARAKTARGLIWTAVSTGGRLAWNKHRKADREVST